LTGGAASQKAAGCGGAAIKTDFVLQGAAAAPRQLHALVRPQPSGMGRAWEPGRFLLDDTGKGGGADELYTGQCLNPGDK